VSVTKPRCGRLAVVLTFAALLAVGNGVAALSQTRAFPAQLVGQWTRTVTAVDVKRSGSTDVSAGSVWTLTIKKSGAASISTPTSSERSRFTGHIVPAGANRVHIYVPFVIPNVYRWRVSGRLLTFTKISDKFATAAPVFPGVWKRK
jgi:hypothetical protein